MILGLALVISGIVGLALLSNAILNSEMRNLNTSTKLLMTLGAFSMAVIFFFNIGYGLTLLLGG